MRALLVLAAACGSAPPTAMMPSPVATWDGDYQLVRVDDKTRSGYEHWVTSAGVRFGVSFDDDGFEVMVVDNRTFTAMPGGVHAIEMREASVGRYVGDAGAIAYTKAGDILEVRLTKNGADRVSSFTRVDGEPAPALEQADTAFASDVASRGIDGWVAAFEPGGAQMTKKGRIDGADAIRALMSDTLAKGKLAWTPTASRAHGPYGFTVGVATYTGATPEDSWKSTYVTVWHRQRDGSWKVAFDTGAAAHE